MKTEDDIRPHEFDLSSPSAASPYCAAMVMRGGGGDECGLPREHVAHGSYQHDTHAIPDED